MASIEKILKHETAGDPMSGLKWTHKTVRKIASELNGIGIDVGKDTVAKLLKNSGFALRVNYKKLSGGKYSTPEAQEKRNSQFEYIKLLREKFAREGMPRISVDTKKKELVGLFKNAGKTWEIRPVNVNDHDFRSQADGIAIPFGIYDFEANAGAIFVGMSHDTPAFAVDSIVQWWDQEGRKRYHGASKILIVADSGGSNGARVRAWKYDLYYKLALPYGLEITVAHYPPGTSKWNPIEHRLFSEISKNWQGVPLRDYETIQKYIQATKTSTGLKITSYLNEREYKTGQKVTAAQMKEVKIVKHETNPELNYTLNAENSRCRLLQKERNKRGQGKNYKEITRLLKNSNRAIDSVKSMLESVLSSKM